LPFRDRARNWISSWPVNPLAPSLRRRVAVALAVTSVLSFAVLGVGATALLSVLSSVGNSDGCHYNAFLATGPPQDCYANYDAVGTVLVSLLLIIGVALYAWILWVTAARVLRPLAATTSAVSQLGPQNLGQRIRMTGADDQLKKLADALDDTLDRLAVGYESQRRFAANASHELRTPLAVQRLLTEVAMDAPDTSEDVLRLGAQLLRANERNEKLIEGLLVLAESDRGLPGKIPVRLDELAESVLDSHLGMAAQHEVSLRRALGERLVPGDPLLLEQLIGNLVTNAIRYNAPGGWVDVVVASEPALTVRNTGQIVPAEAVSSLFEPFRRLTADRTDHGGGVGLGLSIVRSVTTAHGGTIRARPRPEGGLIVEIDLPT